MVPFFFLIAAFAALSVLGRAGVPVAFGWVVALRIALALMFLLTASAHWGRRRADLVRMVPPVFSQAELLVTVTGVLEIMGAAGLLVPATARWAALGLFVLLLALFPANVHAARQQLSIGGQPVPTLLPRALIQLFFLMALAAVALSAG